MGSNSKLQQREKDMISKLPDAVLSHVLSFSGTKYAVRTSILSKRWRNIWATVPNLDLDDEDKYDELGFKAFVNRVLSVRDSLDINKFRLRCWCADDLSHVDSWISTAVRLHVAELDLSVVSDEDQILELPKCLLTCKTLRGLTMRTNFTIDPPIALCFPSLKFLRVEIYHPDIDSMSRLFSCCPVLEDLTIDGTVGDDVVTFDVIALRLKTLNISLCTEIEVVSDSDSESEDESSEDEYEDHDHVSTDVYSFFINDPKLKNLNLRVDVLSDLFFKYPKSLITANIDLYDHSACEHSTFAHHASALLEAVSNVKYLSLSGHCLQVSCLPDFNNLRELKLVVQPCNHLESLLLELPKRSPNLECFVLDYKVDIWGCTTEGCSENPSEMLQSVSSCLLSKLKTISIMRFRGRPEEMEVAKYLLKNSQVLKKVTISMLKTSCGDAKELHKEFCMFPRGSKACEVEFM